MRTFLLICFLALAGFAPAALARILDRCSLAREMNDLLVPRRELARWACIAKHESSYHTDVVGPPKPDNSTDYGIFQINDLYWCQPEGAEFSYNMCGISCNALLDNNIKQSVTCAQTVLKKQGWTAWSTWDYCKGNLPSIDDCFKNIHP
ncbi:lysozyme B-like [Drosophila obscura]|uniref:lysozyme B-like n=1 Tax=Drosophila obscura TaxID=7282 RepID=UPI001BB22CB4|nr:lysozyme B-like [Drosophila obscura]